MKNCTGVAPKFNAGGLTAIKTGGVGSPVPESWTVRVDALGSSEMIVRVPAAAPVTVGLNVTVTLNGMPGSTVALAGTLENGDPEELMEEIARGRPPVFPMDSMAVPDRQTGILPRLRVGGVIVIWGSAPIPDSATEAVACAGSLVFIVKLPLNAASALGANVTVIVIVAPGGRLKGPAGANV